MTNKDLTNPRDCAVRILYDVFYAGGYSNIKVNEMLKNTELSTVDRKLCTQIVYGVLQHLFLIDFYISRFSSLKLKKISPFVMTILRCGIYQILYLDRVPDSAVCNQSVILAKKYAHLAASGFVNGLLRNIVRNRDNLPCPNSGNLVEDLSVTYTIEPSIIHLWLEQYGEEWVKSLLPSLNKIPDITVRGNVLAATSEEFLSRMLQEGVKVGESDIMPNAYTIQYSGDIGTLPSYKEGLFTVQGLASQLCVQLLDPKPQETVMDLCAAPGGKSFLCAQMMENTGTIYSFDIHNHKVDLIKNGAKRLALTNIQAFLGDSSVLNQQLIGQAHRVLVDAPCSGLGTIAKKPEIRFKTATSIEKLPALQLQILSNGGQYVKKDGILVYSTCTINKKENEEVVDMFLHNNPQFELCDIKNAMKPPLGQHQDRKGMVTLFPHIHQTDGFFICKMRRKSGE